MPKNVVFALGVALLALSAGLDGQNLARLRVTPAGGGGTCDAANVASGASNCPLLTWTDFSFEGAWRVPNIGGSGCNFEYQQYGGIAYSSATKLWVVNNINGKSCYGEVNIPTLSSSGTVTSLNTGTMAQGFEDHYASFYADADGASSVGIYLSAVIPYGGWLYGGGWGYFGTNPAPYGVSNFKLSQTLSDTTWYGAYKLWDGDSILTNTQGYTGQYAAPIPSEWQTALGGPVAWGGNCMPIVTRTSNGPSFIVNDPSTIGISTPNGKGLLYYDDASTALDPYSGSVTTDRFGSTGCVGGMAVIDGTRTVIFLGANGIGDAVYSAPGVPIPHGACYGIPSGPPGDPCEFTPDAEYPAHGYHAPTYRYQYWLYDLNDLKAANDGSLNPHNIVPYEYGGFTLPYTQVLQRISGVAYDAANHRLHFMQIRADGGGPDYVLPVGIAYQVDVTP